MKLSMQFSPTSRHFVSLRLKYSPQHPVLKHSQFSSITQFLYRLQPSKFSTMAGLHTGRPENQISVPIRGRYISR
jgi:hypothetical protein